MIRFTSDSTSDFSVLPRDAGQIVEYAYAVDSESGFLLRRCSQVGKPTSYACRLLDTAGDLRYEPQNGVLPDTYGEWMICEVVE
jgi:hypothetical protein